MSGFGIPASKRPAGLVSSEELVSCEALSLWVLILELLLGVRLRLTEEERSLMNFLSGGTDAEALCRGIRAYVT